MGMETVFRFCPTKWPYHWAVGIKAGAFVKIARVEFEGDNKIAYIYSLRGKNQHIHKVRLDELSSPESTKPMNTSGCFSCKAKCPIDKKAREKLLLHSIPKEVLKSQITPAVRSYLGAIGRLGGLKVSRTKIWALKNAREKLAQIRIDRRNKALLFQSPAPIVIDK